MRILFREVEALDVWRRHTMCRVHHTNGYDRQVDGGTHCRLQSGSRVVNPPKRIPDVQSGPDRLFPMLIEGSVTSLTVLVSTTTRVVAHLALWPHRFFVNRMGGGRARVACSRESRLDPCDRGRTSRAP